MFTYRVIATGTPGATTLRRRGMILPVAVAGPRGAVRTLALWDTGSEVSSVSAPMLRHLGAPQSGSVAIYTVQGDSTVPSYSATLAIALPGGGTYPLTQAPIPLLGDKLGGRAHVLIGREVQALYRVTIDGPAGTWTIEGPAPSIGAQVVTVRSTSPHPWRRAAP